MQRGEIWWAALGPPKGSGPGYRRPVVVVQDNEFNRSKIRTVVIVLLTSNLRLQDAPGNVFLSRRATRLSKNSVANVSQVITVDEGLLTERVGKLNAAMMEEIGDGLRLILGL